MEKQHFEVTVYRKPHHLFHDQNLDFWLRTIARRIQNRSHPSNHSVCQSCRI